MAAPTAAPPAEAAARPAAPPLAPQPIGAVIVGALYRDDAILSVAHQFQVNDETYRRRPTL